MEIGEYVDLWYCEFEVVMDCVVVVVVLLWWKEVCIGVGGGGECKC